MTVVIPTGARVIDIDLDTAETNVFKNVPYETHEQFYSTDIGMAFLKFTGLAQDYTGCTARLTLINFNDGSKVQRIFEMDTTTTFVYPMLETELVHSGRWIGQLAVIKGGTTISDNPFRFKINGPILNTALISFDNINTFTSQLTTIYDSLNTFLDVVILDESNRADAEGLRVVAEGLRVTAEALRETKEGIRQSTFEANEIIRDGIVNSLVTAETIAQKVAEKYQLIEAESASRLLSVEQQLEQNKTSVSPEEFGAIGDGVTDDTLAMQNAINALPMGGTVQCKSKLYFVPGELTIVADGVTIQGTKTSNDGRGTIIITNSSTINPVLKVYNPGRVLVGGAIKNITFMGNGKRQTYTDARDREAIRLTNVAEFNFENVFISGFLRGGLVAKDWWDSTIIGLEIRACGTELVYPALYLGSEDDSSNSLHFFGLHIEMCKYQMKIDGTSSHIQFVASKFEGGSILSSVPTNDYLIFIYEGVYAITFSACFFTSNEIYPHLMVRNNKTIFIGCEFAGGDPTKGINAIKHASANADYAKGLIISACNFDLLSCQVSGVDINKYAIFSDNMVSFAKPATEIKPILVGSDNILKGNHFRGLAHAIGSVYKFSGSGNKLSANTYENGASCVIYDRTSASILNVLDNRTGNITSRTTLPTIDFTKQISDIIWNTATPATLMLSNLLNPGLNQELYIYTFAATLTIADEVAYNVGAYTIPAHMMVKLVYKNVLGWVVESTMAKIV